MKFKRLCRYKILCDYVTKFDIFNHNIKILRGTKKPIIKAIFRVLLLKNQFFVIRKSKKLCSIDVLSFKCLLIAQII